MPRPLFTEDEIILCAYAALYDPSDFGGKQIICTLKGRVRTSVDMKVRNFVAMLDAHGIRQAGAAPGLSGRPKGEGARDTNWEIVSPLTLLSREQLLRKCLHILANRK